MQLTCRFHQFSLSFSLISVTCKTKPSFKRTMDTRELTRVNSGFSGLPLLFEWPFSGKSGKSYIGWIRENERIRPCYVFCPLQNGNLDLKMEVWSDLTLWIVLVKMSVHRCPTYHTVWSIQIVEKYLKLTLKLCLDPNVVRQIQLFQTTSKVS